MFLVGMGVLQIALSASGWNDNQGKLLGYCFGVYVLLDGLAQIAGKR